MERKGQLSQFKMGGSSRFMKQKGSVGAKSPLKKKPKLPFDPDEKLKEQIVELDIKKTGYFADQTPAGLEVLSKAMSTTIQEYLKQDFERLKSKKLTQPIPLESEYVAYKKNMLLNKFKTANRPLFLVNKDQSIKIPLNCLDCMRVHLMKEKMKRNHNILQMNTELYCPLIRAELEIQTMTGVLETDPSEMLKLIEFDSQPRQRGQNSRKYDSSDFDLWDWQELCFQDSYGLKWAAKAYDNRLALPSMQQIFDGLFEHHCEWIDQNMTRVKDTELQRYKDSIQELFQHLLNCVDDCNPSRPLNFEKLKDPYSQELQLLLLLYSIEPPFYAQINEACRSKDEVVQERLGPFACVLYHILEFGYLSELYRTDPLKNGKSEGKTAPIDIYSQSFLLYRGCRLSSELLDQWTLGIGKDIRLPQPTSTCIDFQLALDAALQDSRPSEGFASNGIMARDARLTAELANDEAKELVDHSVVFVLLMTNWNGTNGFRINSEFYTAYPGEKEYLLKEHLPLKVLNVEKDVKIQPGYIHLQGDYMDRVISIVYLYNN